MCIEDDKREDQMRDAEPTQILLGIYLEEVKEA